MTAGRWMGSTGIDLKGLAIEWPYVSSLFARLTNGHSLTAICAAQITNVTSGQIQPASRSYECHMFLTPVKLHLWIRKKLHSGVLDPIPCLLSVVLIISSTLHIRCLSLACVSLLACCPRDEPVEQQPCYYRDYRFHTDGSISVGIQAGGYMETLYWEYPQTAGDLPFGTVVGKNIFAPLHDHLAGERFHRSVRPSLCITIETARGR